MALLEKSVMEHDRSFALIWPMLSRLQMWQQRVIGGLAVTVAILVPILIRMFFKQ